MTKIWVVTKDQEIASIINLELGQNEDCQFCSTPEIEYSPIPEEFTQPDMIIVDLDTVNQKTINLLNLRLDHHSDVAKVALAPVKKGFSIEDYFLSAFDEIINKPSDQQQTSQMLSRISECIATLNRFFQLRKRLLSEMRENQIVGRSKAIRDIMSNLPQLAINMSTVLIIGETGSGKELFARAIHYLGPRAGKPFITIDCGSLSENLVENELFGHVGGAYTDAGQSAKGLLQEAHGGTLFLDEVDALPISIQPRFLRFLQERQYKPLGKASYLEVDARVLAATKTDLFEAVRQKKFRADLYYRLSVVPLFIPSLRERKSDIPVLVDNFLQKYSQSSRTITEIPEETIRNWLDYDWPGNVRELENRVQEWLLIGNREKDHKVNSYTYRDFFTDNIRPLAEERKKALWQFDRQYLHKLLTQTKGNLSAASKLAEIDRKNLRSLLKKYNIDKDLFRL